MLWVKQKQSGFTIVELLIVIVVIAILAAITIVAYNGIQNRASDAAVQSDLRSLAIRFQEYYHTNQSYPRGGSATSAFTDFPASQVSRNAYLPNTNNIYYCVGTIDGVERLGLAAKSRSGTAWMFSSTTGAITTHTGSWGSSGAPCTGTGVPTTTADFFYKFGVWNTNVWNAWIQ
ncbi:MAG: prepilin-type N-terminal cleavage/methylation domain-containing protein [Candidatus Microsaccharimonas sp.]